MQDELDDEAFPVFLVVILPSMRESPASVLPQAVLLHVVEHLIDKSAALPTAFACSVSIEVNFRCD